jgi:uncharacterized protein YdhG (YjbR/CyaY superfamily)
MTPVKPKSIDEYIARFPKDTQKHLEQIRATIKETVPGADEAISYGIPAFNLNGRYLIYFAGYKKHIGLYPVPTNNTFEKEFAAYKTSGKGAIQFPLDKPMPLKLIIKIVKFRVRENADRAKAKK